MNTIPDHVGCEAVRLLAISGVCYAWPRDAHNPAVITVAKLLMNPPAPMTELAEARDKALDEAAETMENLSFMTDISDLIGMTKQEMSVRTCHEGAQAIRALKSPKPPIL